MSNEQPVITLIKEFTAIWCSDETVLVDPLQEQNDAFRNLDNALMVKRQYLQNQNRSGDKSG